MAKLQSHHLAVWTGDVGGALRAFAQPTWHRPKSLCPQPALIRRQSTGCGRDRAREEPWKHHSRLLAQWAGQGFGAFKPALADLAVDKLTPIAAELRRLMGDPGALDAILRDGAERAQAIAEPIMRDVRALVGFWR